MPTTLQSLSSTKLRLGIAIWVLSWMPFPTLVVHLLHSQGHLTTTKATSLTYGVLWGTQIIIGLLGLWLAGKQTVTLAKSNGIRALPKNLWRIIWRGTIDSSSDEA